MWFLHHVFWLYWVRHSNGSNIKGYYRQVGKLLINVIVSTPEILVLAVTHIYIKNFEINRRPSVDYTFLLNTSAQI